MAEWLYRVRCRWQDPQRVSLNLALQGGGSHGAFTWGVLDRLLEEPHLALEGISGTSAGAINGVALASGWLQGGAEQARLSLEQMWRRVSERSVLGPLQASPLDYLLQGWNRDWSPGYMLVNSLARMASPYQFNPGGYNPLIPILDEVVDFERLRAAEHLRLFIAATHVPTGSARLFRNPELDARVIAASACLPTLFQAVEIDDEPYWDGCYTANPALWPLFLECSSRDLLLVQVTPPERPTVPTRSADITDRANEIAFNANLARELELLRMLRDGGSATVSPALPWRRHRLHAIDSGFVTEDMGRNSRINPEWGFLCHLRDEGRRRADLWLQSHGSDLGRRSSLTDR